LGLILHRVGNIFPNRKTCLGAMFGTQKSFGLRCARCNQIIVTVSLPTVLSKSRCHRSLSSDHQPLVYATSTPRRPTLLSALVSPIYLSPYIPRTPLASEWLDAQWHSWQLGSYFYNARSSPTRPRSHPVLRSHLAAHGLSSCVITSTFDYRVPSSQSLLASDML
jgi:hypothetical protein